MIISGDTCSLWSCNGVDFPTHAASHQCILGSCRRVRLYLVSPPDPHSIGSPSDCSLLKSSQRVALIALASFKGPLVCAMIFINTSGFFFRKSWISRVPLARLHFSQARHRFDTLSVPPLARGTMCSTCKGISFFWQ